MKKHISYRSGELLNALIARDQHFFTIKDAQSILRNSEEIAVRRLLIYMAQKGLLLRIKDGLYHVIPYEKDVDSYFPNWHLTAEAMVEPMKYYIGFYSALDIHGLITQPSLIEQVVTEKQMIPKIRMVGKVKFEFITLNKKWFFGFEKTWIDDFNKIYCSDYEKTIIDCLYKPSYGGGITEIVKAIYRKSNEVDQNKLVSYLNRVDSQVVIKRLGFVLQHLGILESLRKEIKTKVSNSYAYLEPSLPKKGKHTSEWKIIDNSNIESVIKSIET